MEHTTPIAVSMVDPSRMTPNYDSSLCEALAHEDCEVALYARQGRRGEPPLEVRGFAHEDDFYRLSEKLRRKNVKVSQALKPLDHLFGLVRLFRRLASAPPDIVHLQWLVVPLLDRLFIEVTRRRIAPVVVTVHDTNTLHGASRYSPQRFGMDGALEAADALVVHTEYSVAQLGERPAGQLVSVTPHAIWEVPVAHVEDPTRLRVLMFGRIREYKGTDILIEALALLDPSTQVEVTIAGDPLMDVSALQQRAVELGVHDRITWTLRFLDEDETHAAFNNADVVALPYRDIDASGVLSQAFGYGVPVVAARIGGFATAIDDGQTGLLIDPESPEQLAKALDRLAGDPALRASITKDIQEAAKKMTWKAQAQETKKLYLRLAGRGQT